MDNRSRQQMQAILNESGSESMIDESQIRELPSSPMLSDIMNMGTLLGIGDEETYNRRMDKLRNMPKEFGGGMHPSRAEASEGMFDNYQTWAGKLYQEGYSVDDIIKIIPTIDFSYTEKYKDIWDYFKLWLKETHGSGDKYDNMEKGLEYEQAR